MKSLTLIVTVLVMATAFLVVGSVALAQSGASAPATGNITVRDGINPGEVVLSWDAVPQATHYRIGYVNMETDYPLAKVSVTGDWINAFIYVDENARNVPVSNGRAEYTVRRLEQGVRHAFTVLTSSNFVDTGAAGSVSSEFSWPSNPRWDFHTVADRGGATAPAPIDWASLYPNCDAVQAHFPGGATRGSPIYRPALDQDGDGIACGATDTAPQPPGNPVPLQPMDIIESDSTTASAAPEIRLVINSLPMSMSVGGSIVIYLEDDFQEPDSIPLTSVYLVAEGGNAMQMRTTGRGARVYVTSPVKISTSDYFDPDKDDIAVRVLVPDMCTNATDECEGPNGLHMGQKVSVVLENDSGIRNPSEAGTHSTGYALLGPSETEIPGTPQHVTNTVATVAKIRLSDVDNSRGYELTVTGSGFNDGVTAAIYVLHDPTVGYVPSGDAEKALCRRIISEGTLVGHSVVGSDGRVAVTFEVTVPPFGLGSTNYICMVDGTGLMSDTDVEDFRLEPSIRVVPSAASVGDIVTVFAQDLPNPGAAFTRITLAGRPVPGATGTSVGADGSATATFTVPTGVIGIVRLDAEWGRIRENTKIRILQ